MAHIHTEPGQYDLTSGALIVRLDLPKPAILLHFHKSLNMWMHFGGHVELNENPWQAVTREIREESGYELSQLKLLQPDIPQLSFSDAISHPWPAALLSVKYKTTDHYHTEIAYALTTSQEPAGDVAKGESHTFKTFTAGELAALTDDEIPPNMRTMGLQVLDNYLKKWKEVPAPN